MSKNKNEVKLGYDDITIVPAKVSDIISRSQCDCTDKYDMLPIFAAPMDTVINKETFQEFAENGIYPVIPRTETLDDRLKFVLSMIKGDYRVSETFVAFSLYEAIDIFCYAREDAYSKELDDKILSFRSYLENSLFSCECRICIDLANGHMSCLLETIKAIKTHHGNKVIIMSGNIANPKTYEEYEKVGCDFVRCNIGSGGCCFVAGTQVTMADGTTENIEDINVGDYVSTLNGPQKIINTFERETNETVIINNEIECTPDHLFLVIKKTKIYEGITNDEILKHAEYIKASLLNSEYLLVSE